MCKCVRDADRLDSLKPHYTVNDISTEVEFKKGAVNLSCTRFKTRIRQSGSQVRLTLHTHIRTAFNRRLRYGLTDLFFRLKHIRFETDQGQIKGDVKKVQGRAVRVAPRTQFTAKIKSVVTVGKEELTGAEASRADLILGAFKGSDVLFSSPFIRKVFFPKYPLHTLEWPEMPTTQPKITFTYRDLNKSQRKAVEKCLSNKEADRHVVIVVSSSSSLYFLISRWVSGTARDWKDHCHRRRCSEQGRRARIEHGLGHRTIERRGQERGREIG